MSEDTILHGYHMIVVIKREHGGKDRLCERYELLSQLKKKTDLTQGTEVMIENQRKENKGKQ